VLGESPHLALAFGEVPELFKSSMGDRDRGLTYIQSEVSHAACVAAQEKANVGPVRRHSVSFSSQLSRFHPGHSRMLVK
jgi:hypothetical protein